MGLHISIDRLPDHKSHPDWDVGRYAGDREFVAFAAALPRVESITSQYPDFERYIRPADFAVWREALVKWQEERCEGRFEQMLDILEADQDYWIYFSY